VEKETAALLEFSDKVLDQAPIGICTFNNEYIVTSFNKYFEDLTGFKKANIIGRNLFEAIPSIIEGGWENMYRKVIETGEPYIIDNYQYKVRYGPHKGKTLYSSNKIVPLTLNGNIRGAIVIYEDISEQIFMEEEKKKAKKAKLELEKRRDKFIWMASHELRTPMTVIRGYIDFLQNHFDNLNLKSREKIFRVLASNMSRLERLSNQVSELGQVEYGTFELNETHIDICNFIDQCIEPYRLLYGHQIRFRGCKGLTVNYEGDPDRLQQVIDNIMENAIKQTSKEHREIFISLVIFPDQIVIRITDNGIGIAPENLETIFEQFRSIPTDYIATGTGIGLFLSRRIIEDHGGKITAQSDGKGQGATFTIELPI
jgi:PAS domain S-box-containing protein